MPASPTTRTETTTSTFAVEVTATTAVDQPAEHVWAILTDTGAYERWNPFIISFAGQIEAGDRIDVSLQLPDRKPQRMRPKVVEVVSGRSFTWLGHVGVPGILDGRHHFEVRSTGPSSCELVQHERLSGVLLPMFRTMLATKTPQAFTAMNDALLDEAGRQS